MGSIIGQGVIYSRGIKRCNIKACSTTDDDDGDDDEGDDDDKKDEDITAEADFTVRRYFNFSFNSSIS